jgi:glyoxylase-like metal-dependent hydrolase (beta-lactamase superfamily II)
MTIGLPGLLTAQSSVTFDAAVEGRRVIDAVVAAMGGRQALRSVRTIVTEESIRRRAGRQGLAPASPMVTEGHRTVQFDVVGQRINELRLLDAGGNQRFDVQRFLTPSFGTIVSWPSMTKDSVPVLSLANERAGVGRRHLLPLLISADRRVAAVRSLGSVTIDGTPHDAVSITDIDGTLLTLVVNRQTHLPARIEQLAIGPASGDGIEVSAFSDYRRVGALTLPFRRDEVRSADVSWEYRVEQYEIDKPIPDSVFRVPAGLARATTPVSQMVKLAPDVYLVPNAYRSVFVVFDDYVLVLEGGGSTAQARNTVARIRQVAPGKPIRYVVATHFHDDHIAGLRTFIGEGTTIVTTSDARGPIEALAKIRYGFIPDTLDLVPRAPIIEVVERERVFKDARHEVRIHQIGPTAHVNQILVAYLPNERIVFEGDLLDITNGQPDAAGDPTAELAQALQRLGITFDRLIPVHGDPGTAADLEKSLRRGRGRAQCPPGKDRRAPCVVDDR